MIRWMAEHKVAANLLMVIILLSGLMGTMNIKQEVFPEMELDFIVVSVPYSGATPEEIEKFKFSIMFVSLIFNETSLNTIISDFIIKSI